jgi:hypothetical protein
MGLFEKHLRLERFLDKYIRTVFPKRVQPSKQLIEMLKVIYPTLDLDRIRFFEGIPWFTRYVAPYVTAQALPDTYSLRKLNIHVKEYDESSPNILADIVHEAYHMVQYERFQNAWGIGFLRSFIVYYNACYITRGYRNNPFEIPAYEQEYAFLRFIATHKLDMRDQYDVATLEHLVDQTQMRTHEIEYKYEGKFHHLAVSFLFSAAVAVVKPAAELLLLLNYGLLKGVSFGMKLLNHALGQSRKAV